MNRSASFSFSQIKLAQRHSLLMHVLGVTHYVYRRTRDDLAQNWEYRNLSLNYQGFFTLLAERDYAPGELAQRLLISRQACSKVIRELEQLKLITRRPNPNDGRSNIVSLSDEGKLLLKRGGEATLKCLKVFTEKVGDDRLEELNLLLERLCRELGVEIPYYQALNSESRVKLERGPARLNVFLSHLSNYIYQYIIDALAERGFDDLKVNFSQVLAMVGPNGARIQDIAAAVGVSKQAISAIVSELEQLDFIVRKPDPADGRQVILWMTARGERLIAQSQDCIDEFMQQLNDCLSSAEQQFLQETMASLFEAVGGQQVTGTVSPSKIQQLATQLREELGEVGVRMLARYLISN